MSFISQIREKYFAVEIFSFYQLEDVIKEVFEGKKSVNKHI